MLPPAITPSSSRSGAVGRMVLNGTLFVHIGYTMFRSSHGLALAMGVGVPSAAHRAASGGPEPSRCRS